MAPSVDVVASSPVPVAGGKITTSQETSQKTPIKEPLKYSGSLDAYKNFDVTPIIGREFPDVQLTDILNDDAKLRDLAITGELSLSVIAKIIA